MLQLFAVICFQLLFFSAVGFYFVTLLLYLCLAYFFHCWLSDRNGIQPVKTASKPLGMLVNVSSWSTAQCTICVQWPVLGGCS